MLALLKQFGSPVDDFKSNWPCFKAFVKKHISQIADLRDKELVEYKSIFSQLSIAKNGVILKGKHMVIPASLVDQVVKLAHEGHQRDNVKIASRRKWFPKIDAKDEACENCKI